MSPFPEFHHICFDIAAAWLDEYAGQLYFISDGYAACRIVPPRRASLDERYWSTFNRCLRHAAVVLIYLTYSIVLKIVRKYKRISIIHAPPQHYHMIYYAPAARDTERWFSRQCFIDGDYTGFSLRPPIGPLRIYFVDGKMFLLPLVMTPMPNTACRYRLKWLTEATKRLYGF